MAELGEPRQNLVKRAGHPNDGTPMQGNQGLVVAWVRVLDHGDRVLPDRIPDAIHAGNEDETGHPLPLHGHACVAYDRWRVYPIKTSMAREQLDGVPSRPTPP